MSRRSSRRRPLNIGRLKAAIVFGTGWITALVSGITGLGAQAAYAPMLTWMLGYAPVKAQGTALNFAAWTAAAGVMGAYAAGVMPAGFILSGLALVVGAIVGAILAMRLAKQFQGLGWRRMFQSVGVALMLAAIVQASHSGGLFTGKPNVAECNTPGLLMVLGIGVGAATQILGLAGGTLLVPGLYFFSGIHNGSNNYAAPAVALSLFVIALASAIPAMAYNLIQRKAQVRTELGTEIVAAGLIGGFCGGWMLPNINGRVVIMLSAVIAMFLCARELARMAYNQEAEAVSEATITEP